MNEQFINENIDRETEEELINMIKREEQQDLINEANAEEQYQWIQFNKNQLMYDFINELHPDDFEEYCINAFLEVEK